MDEVHRARGARLELGVAVKVLPAPASKGPERRARFKLEVEAIAAISHPTPSSVTATNVHRVPSASAQDLNCERS